MDDAGLQRMRVIKARHDRYSRPPQIGSNADRQLSTRQQDEDASTCALPCFSATRAALARRSLDAHQQGNESLPQWRFWPPNGRGLID